MKQKQFIEDHDVKTKTEDGQFFIQDVYWKKGVEYKKWINITEWNVGQIYSFLGYSSLELEY